MENLNLDNVFVHFIDMDLGIKEQVTANSDGSYSIFLNSRFGYEEHLKSYIHAVTHIINQDFSKEDADKIERAAHSVIHK